MGEVVAVDSVVYNMAGDETARPKFMKNLVIRNVLSGTKDGIGETIIKGHLNGPAIRLRSFYRWASNPDHYGHIGMPTANLKLHGTMDGNEVAQYIASGPGQTVWVQLADVGYGDLDYWAKQWILINRPVDIDDVWEAEYDAVLSQVTITFSDTTTAVFTVTDYDPSATYVYTEYVIVSENTVGTTVVGDVIALGVGETFPDTTDWTLLSTDPGPPIETIYEKSNFISDPATGDPLLVTETMHQFDDGGSLSYRIDVRSDTYNTDVSLRYDIYKIGSGNAALDALAESSASYGNFFPFIPLRIQNQFLSETYYPDAFAQTTNAYKKATNGRLTEIINQISANPSLGDIDHGYVVFGVSLNVLENSCKRYLFEFFNNLMPTQQGGINAADNYDALLGTRADGVPGWNSWLTLFDSTAPLTSPTDPNLPLIPTNTVRIYGTGDLNSRYDMRLQWSFIDKNSGTGLGKVGAKRGDCWLEYVGENANIKATIDYQTLNLQTAARADEYEIVRIYYQDQADSYVYLDLHGMIHRNYVYGSNIVQTGARDAINEVNESGFIVPLHYDTWRGMSLIDTTQMATACVFVVFNCYTVRKTRWYESWIFRVVLVLIIAVVSVVVTGGAGIGIFGSHLAVGSALGLTGLSAAIAGSIINALGAMIIMTVVEKATASLGLFGQILGALLMFMIGQVSASIASGSSSLTMNWGSLLKVDNLIKLTNAVSNGVVDMMRNDVISMQDDFEIFSNNADRESKKIQSTYLTEFGYGNGMIDPLMFTNSSDAIWAESSDTFLTRTLMSGSDIAEMSRDMLYNFSEYSLTLPNAFT